MGDIVQMPRRADLAAQIRRADAIQNAIAKKPHFPAGDEHLVAARNLDSILERAKHLDSFDIHNVLRAKEVNLAGNGHTDSTKRLHEYTLPKDAKDNRKSVIAKKPGKYFQIARAIASELGEPEPVLVSRVFEGCSIGTEHAIDADWDSENWSRLYSLLSNMAHSVIKAHGLEEYWRKVRATNGVYEIRSNILSATPQPLGYLFEGEGLAGDCVCSDESAPVPSVSLGRRLQGAPLAGWISFEADSIVPVEYFFWLEVRLALGPVNDHLSVGPLLEFRTVLEGRLEDGRIAQLDNPHTDTSGSVKRAFIDGETLAVLGLDIQGHVEVCIPEFREDAEHCYFSWRELNPAILHHLLDPADKKIDEVFNPVRRHAGLWVANLPPSRFSRASAAGALHTDLLNGTLEAELGAACDKLIGKLDILRAQQECAIIDAESEAMARWTTLSSTKKAKTGVSK